MRRIVIAIIGGTLLLLGVAMVVLPGPAFIIIPAGLAILATEFVWAKHALDKCKGVVRQARRMPLWRAFRWRRSQAP